MSSLRLALTVSKLESGLTIGGFQFTPCPLAVRRDSSNECPAQRISESERNLHMHLVMATAASQRVRPAHSSHSFKPGNSPWVIAHVQILK